MEGKLCEYVGVVCVATQLFVRIRDFARVYHVCFEHVHRKKSHASRIKNSLDSSHSLRAMIIYHFRRSEDHFLRNRVCKSSMLSPKIGLIPCQYICFPFFVTFIKLLFNLPKLLIFN